MGSVLGDSVRPSAGRRVTSAGPLAQAAWNPRSTGRLALRVWRCLRGHPPVSKAESCRADNLEQPRPCRVCGVATEVGTGELMPVQRRVNVCSVVGVGISPVFTALSLCCPPWLMCLHGVEATDGVAGASPPAHTPSPACGGGDETG